MNKTITVKGIGKVSAKPDSIVLSMALSGKDTEYEKTMELAAKQLDALRSAVVSADFERDALKTVNFGIEPCFENEKDRSGNYKRRFTGYEFSYGLKLEFDFDMAKMAAVLSALAKCIAEPEFSVKFTVKDKDAVNTKLLKNAAENAKRKAEILCAASGVKLGNLITIDYNWSELNLYSSTQYEMADCCLAEAPSASIDMEPDDIDVSDTVTFVWELQ
jgi:uncharacterized protein YggE